MQLSVDEVVAEVHELASGVMEQLGAGHSEAVYHTAMLVALSEAGIPYRSEVCCPFMYGTSCVGYGKANIVVGNAVIEIKISSGALSECRTQLLRYVEALGRLENRTFTGIILVMDKSAGSVRLQAIDHDGDVIHDSALLEDPDLVKFPVATISRESELYTAFRKRYKFVPRPGPRSGVRLDRLMANMRACVSSQLSVCEFDDAISQFLQEYFICETQTRGRAGAEEVVMCYPRHAAGVMLW
eukprot:3939386-Rhodomonas_salina.9